MMLTYPHCDCRVLHAPSTCKVCDMYPEWQELRQTWNINFTREFDESKTLCPSSVRDLEIMERWLGNRPAK